MSAPDLARLCAGAEGLGPKARWTSHRLGEAVLRRRRAEFVDRAVGDVYGVAASDRQADGIEVLARTG